MIVNPNPNPAPVPTTGRKHRRLLAVAGVSAMAAVAVSLSGVASAATPTKTNCTFKTTNGHYVTAVNSGGLTGLGQPSFDVIHTDAVRVGTWETFCSSTPVTERTTVSVPLMGTISPP